MSELNVDRTKTALVVIDLQKGIASVDARPHDATTVISNAARLADAFRRNGMPVFLIHVEGTAGTSLQPISDTVMQMRGERPPDWADIVPELGPKPTDVVITKRQWGAFYGTDLELRLRRGGHHDRPGGDIDQHRGGEHRKVRLRVRLPTGVRRGRDVRQVRRSARSRRGVHPEEDREG